MLFFDFQFLNVPMFRNVTLKCLTEIGRFATLIYSLFSVLYHYVIKTGDAAKLLVSNGFVCVTSTNTTYE